MGLLVERYHRSLARDHMLALLAAGFQNVHRGKGQPVLRLRELMWWAPHREATGEEVADFLDGLAAAQNQSHPS